MFEGTPQPDGAIDRALTAIAGRSWRTSIAGALFAACGVIASLDVVSPGLLPAALVALCTVATPVLGGVGLRLSKDARVSGAPR